MANERLRAAMRHKGLDPDELATIVQVDVKTVYRWLAGRSPRPRFRAQLAKALERPERELWPEIAIEAPVEDPQREIQGAWPHTNDYRAPDWRALMRDAVEQIDLLDYSLIQIVGAAGVIDMLRTKGASGCEVRALIAASDSVWVASAAKQLDQDEEDYVSRNELQREIELARGHLEPLIGQPGIEIRAFYAERYNTILRFDEQMLITLHLWGTSTPHAPMLHLRRRATAACSTSSPPTSTRSPNGRARRSKPTPTTTPIRPRTPTDTGPSPKRPTGKENPARALARTEPVHQANRRSPRRATPIPGRAPRP
jgi:transcriptional regulator with XRE-family HTH domain